MARRARSTTPRRKTFSPQRLPRSYEPTRTTNNYEKAEILSFKQVYYIPMGKDKLASSEDLRRGGVANFGYDDDKGDYRFEIGDHMQYRFEIVQRLGRGSFGQVVKALDHRLGEHVALKIIRNKKRFHKQALVEVRILAHLR